MRSRRWFLRLTLLAIVLAIGASAVLFGALRFADVAAVQSRIDAYRPVLTVLRLALIGATALAWPTLVHWARQTEQIGARRSAQLLAARWRMVVWLLLLEVFLGQNLVGRLLLATTGAVV